MTHTQKIALLAAIIHALTIPYNHSMEEDYSNQQPPKKKLKLQATFEDSTEIQSNSISFMPLKAIALQAVLKYNLVDESVKQSLSCAHLLPWLHILSRVKKFGYTNNKLVLELINLTINSTYVPDVENIVDYIRESASLGDHLSILLLIERGATKQETDKDYPQDDNTDECSSEENDLNTTVRDDHHSKEALLRLALLKATKKNQVACAQEILKEIKYDEHTQDNTINEGLTRAASKEMVDLYLAHTAQLNVPILNCLGKAVLHKNAQLVDYLLTKGASPTIIYGDHDHETNAVKFALEIMSSGDSVEEKELAKTFIAQFAVHSPLGKDSVLIHILNASHLPGHIREEAASIALQHNPKIIDEQDEQELTALMWAVEELLLNAVYLLLDHNANTLLKNDDDQTAIELAQQILISKYEHYEVDEETRKIMQDKRRQIAAQMMERISIKMKEQQLYM